MIMRNKEVAQENNELLEITRSLAIVKKSLAVFPSPAGMSLTKLSLGGNNLNFSRPGRVW